LPIFLGFRSRGIRECLCHLSFRTFSLFISMFIAAFLFRQLAFHRADLRPLAFHSIEIALGCFLLPFAGFLSAETAASRFFFSCFPLLDGLEGSISPPPLSACRFSPRHRGVSPPCCTTFFYRRGARFLFFSRFCKQKTRRFIVARILRNTIDSPAGDGYRF